VKRGTPLSANDNVNIASMIDEDYRVRTKDEIITYLMQKRDDLKFVCKAHAILGNLSKEIIRIGFIRLLQGYYMLAVTEAECIAKIASKPNSYYDTI
jgi:hypothetical protein